MSSLRLRSGLARSKLYRSADTTALSASNAGDLHTGYEWLARRKAKQSGTTDRPAGQIKWIDIVSTADDDDDVGNVSEYADVLETLPLYPVGAVHIPYAIHLQTLNNIEPRNVKMAQDLRTRPTKRLFVTTLRASDTGRIASVGTLMEIIDTEDMKSYDGSLIAIRLRCRALGPVRIVHIINPQCWTKERRIKKSDEYLLAKIRRTDDDDLPSPTLTVEEHCDRNDPFERLVDDYTAVRSEYTKRDGVAARELPPFAVDAVQNNLPSLSLTNFTTNPHASFWRATEAWHTLCNTAREARRSDLQSEVNEITITAAMAKGGPLKLPVHRSDLPQDVRARLNKMEEDAATDFVALGMDPIIDFQALLSCDNSFEERVEYLAAMIRRERKRLEAKESLKAVFNADVEADTALSASLANNLTSVFG